MELQPSRDVHAEVGFVEFHNTKATLPRGTYRVIEADGDISYAVLGEYRGTLVFDIKWFTEAEYETAIYDQVLAARNDCDFFDDRDGEELMDSWNEAIHVQDNGLGVEIEHVEDGDLTDTEFNQMVGEVYERNEEESRAFGKSMSSEPKTLGELLREAWATPDPELNEPTLRGECVKFLSVAKDQHDWDHLKTVFENGKFVNEESPEVIRERVLRGLDEVKAAQHA